MDRREQADSLCEKMNRNGKLYRYNVDNLKEIRGKGRKNPHFII